jgi:hypothetical protein
MVSQFNESDEAILRHVLRYRLTTPHILSCSEILALSEAEIADRLERLVSLGLLASAPLITGYDEPKYFHLTEAAAISLGQDIAVAKPLKVDARAEWFAVASFCCCGDTVRELFTKEEFQTQFKHLWFVGQPVRYYLEPGDDGVVRLAFIKVDTGGPGQWDRLIDSCQRFLHQRTTPDKVAKAFRDKVSAYASMVEQGRFQISILTALPEKQRAIALELERRRLKEPPAPPIKAYVVPGLLEVLHPRPH